eukprot:CAMPEP_0182432722 /NCGR_PEP_ID=MMETSP1167-20130531/58449_1 /TAXON_ID=2988 /ORGANISM="Mallomonas Sp, Strain CCMP3275" /LENGTH=629 /DNA_ID=CAMNT_0024620567 /DNA_START=383 /DNA_END=2272 /DNA_ORIENTATION=-
MSGALLPCSGNGQCLSLREVSEYENFIKYTNRSTYADWDADAIHGCLCDEGWEGVKCSRKSCPPGDDPLTTGHDEIQLLDCKCDSCDGHLRLSYNGRTTARIPHDATTALIRHRLLQLPDLEHLTVSFLRGRSLCSAAGSITQVQISVPGGDIPALQIDLVAPLNGTIGIRSRGETSRIDSNFSSVRGTRERVECSNHGTCDYSKGSCVCFTGYGSSNGLGSSGARGDCGFKYLKAATYSVSANVTVNNTCPYIRSMNSSVNSSLEYCSGKGVCNHTTGVCSCDTGYGGPGCTYRTCETTKSWFGNLKGGHEGYSMCSGVGECDRSTGRCSNCGGGWGVFAGSHCERMTCASPGGNTCSGNGVCLSLRELAAISLNAEREPMNRTYSQWDADMVHGCACSRTYTVDNQFPPGQSGPISFYRGPYAYAVSDWTSYDCSAAQCPRGDSPLLAGARNEIQLMRCRANNGTMKLYFRGNYSDDISYNATGSTLAQTLRNMYTIHNVDVSIDGANNSTNATICNYYNNTKVYIEFVWDFGDLPLLTVDRTNLQDMYSNNLQNEYLVNITEFQKGTKQDIECSGVGVCNEKTGQCACADGFQSSNGTLTQPGERGDCGFYNAMYVVGYDGEEEWD